MRVGDSLQRAARLYGARVAAICADEQRSFAELEERSNRIAQALTARGLRAGDRVATWFENSIRCIELDYALAKAGMVRVSINPRLTPREAQFILQDSDARVLFYGASFDEQVDAACSETLVEFRVRAQEDSDPTGAGNPVCVDYEVFLAAGSADAPIWDGDAEQIYCLFYTSGTTGRPKGVMISHRAMLHIAWNLLMECGPIALGEKILLMQPLSHGAGFFVLPQAMKGGASVLMRTFDPAEVIRLAQLHEIEVIKLIPTMIQRILRLPDLDRVSLPKLRYMIYGASPMPAEPLKQAIQIFGPGKLVQIYGQSEAAVTLSILPAEDHRLDQPYPDRLLSAGRPWSTVEMRVVDEAWNELPVGGIGEVVLRAPHMMSGYWKRPGLMEELVRDGWLRTKDMGRIDAHGYVYLLGRTDEMIISGGYNIAPREVEDVLYQHPSVQETAVVGEADAEWGNAVVAYVVLRAGHDDAAPDLLRYAREHLGFKRPKKVYLLAELPKNASGKIQKSALKPAVATAAVLA